MFKFLKKHKKINKSEEEKENKNANLINKISSDIAATKSSNSSVIDAKIKFAKPEKYNRRLYDDNFAKRKAKIHAFSSEIKPKDPYTGKTLVSNQAEAKLKYGDKWTEHASDIDHKIPLEKLFQKHKNPWNTVDEQKKAFNSNDNLEAISAKYNRSKGAKTNEEFINNLEEKQSIQLSSKSKNKLLKSSRDAEKSIENSLKRSARKNMVKTGHVAGVQAAKHSGVTSATISSITNMVEVVQGKKEADEAIKEITLCSAKAAASGYLIGNGLTLINHTLSSSSSKVISSLGKANVPAKVLTTIMLTGDTFKKYSTGQINTEECMIELGKTGLCFATTGYSMAIGQTVIPIPIVGAAVGAFVGQALTCNAYDKIILQLKNNQFTDEEKYKMMEESNELIQRQLLYQKELQNYLDSYFGEYKNCFDDALNQIEFGFETGDADAIISGSNKISKKLGGKTQYNTVEEFKAFLNSDEDFIL